MRLSDIYSRRNGWMQIIAAVIIVYLLLSLVTPLRAEADQVLAGCGVNDTYETETEDPNSWSNSEPAPFTIKIRFDEKYETVTEKDSAEWRRLTPAGYYIWDSVPVREYFSKLKEKYDSEEGKVKFDTHNGVHMVFKSSQCGWHMNLDMTVSRLEEGQRVYQSGLEFRTRLQLKERCGLKICRDQPGRAESVPDRELRSRI